MGWALGAAPRPGVAEEEKEVGCVPGAFDANEWLGGSAGIGGM
jgi:hypothetical protein